MLEVRFDHRQMVARHGIDLKFSRELPPNCGWITRHERADFGSHESYLASINDTVPMPDKLCR